MGDARVRERRRRRAEGVQGKTHPPDVADKLPLELKAKAWRIIGDSPTELEDVIKDLSISQRVQNRHLVILTERTSRSSRRARGPPTSPTNPSTPTA